MAAPVNPDLIKERKDATFDTLKLTHMLDGGEERTEMRRKDANLLLEDEKLKSWTGRDFSFQSRPEQYEHAVRKAARFMEIATERGLGFTDAEYWAINGAIYPNETCPLALHMGMFTPTLMNLCSEEQSQIWLPKAKSFEIIGTYAQTEMGHGTHLRGLETTATYDPKTEEFVIHSPTLSATKWWPGGLGLTCDHAVVMAQLHTQGRSLGMHAFIVQFRDLKTHRHLPGAESGDIGPKLGYNTIDNGFLRFDNFRIPRVNMLMKNNEVLRDGTYVSKTKNQRLTYGTMVMVRAAIVRDQAFFLAQALTIAVRYSCVRRQMEIKPGAGEVQVLDYQTQQYKLLPLIATAYTCWFTAQKINIAYATAYQDILKGNAELLSELHAATSCLKAFSSYASSRGMETCRLACGGHGYSLASGIPKIYGHGSPGITYEGENTVLYLQTAKYLNKAYEKNNVGEKVTKDTSYLNFPVNAKSSIGQDLSPQSLLDAFRYKAARLVERAARRYSSLCAKQEQHVAWNNSTVTFVDASEAHAQVYAVDCFMKVIAKVKDDPVKEVLTQLYQLYACNTISENSSIFVETGFVSPAQIDLINDAVLALMEKIRPNAVALVDAFDFTDTQLGSVLGRYDGNVYETMFEWAKSNPLNDSEVHPSFDKYMKPFREEMQASKL